MKLLEQLHRWRQKFYEQMSQPAFIPLTREELTVVVSDCPAYRQTESFIVDTPPKLFGVNVFESPFAEEMRCRQVEIPVTQISEGHNISNWAETINKEASRDYLHRKLTAYICHDTTSFTLTFEWDSLAKFKRKFRLTKRFPVRTRTVTIEGRVLYPYLKVSLPFNKHHAQFQHIK